MKLPGACIEWIYLSLQTGHQWACLWPTCAHHPAGWWNPGASKETHLAPLSAFA